MKKILMIGIILCFLLSACIAPSAVVSEDPSSNVTPQPHLQKDDASSLASLVQWEDDEYLATICTSQTDALEHLCVKAVYPEIQLSENGAKGVIVLFIVKDTPHAAGSERTIALLLDQKTASFIDQVTITADDVTPHFLDESRILFLNTINYAGMSSYALSILQATSSGWITTDPGDLFSSPLVSSEDEPVELCYAVTGDTPLLLHVFQISYGNYPMEQPEYIHKQTFLWDKELHLFLPTSTSGFEQ